MMADRGQAQPSRRTAAHARAPCRARSRSAIALVGDAARGRPCWSRCWRRWPSPARSETGSPTTSRWSWPGPSPSCSRGDFGALLSKRLLLRESAKGTWRPFCTLTYMLDARCRCTRSTFKLDSLLWHIAAAWLVMALARRLLPEGGGAAPSLPACFSRCTRSPRRPSTTPRFARTRWSPSSRWRRCCWRSTAAPGWSLGAFGAGPAVEGVGGGRARRSWRSSAGTLRPREPLALGPPAPAPRVVSTVARRLVASSTPSASSRSSISAIRFGPMKTPVAYAQYPGGTFGATLVGLPAIWAHDLRLAGLARGRSAPTTRAPSGSAASRRCTVRCRRWLCSRFLAAIVCRRAPRRAGWCARARLVLRGAAPRVEPAAHAHPGRRAFPVPAAVRDRAGRAAAAGGRFDGGLRRRAGVGVALGGRPCWRRSPCSSTCATATGSDDRALWLRHRGGQSALLRRPERRRGPAALAGDGDRDPAQLREPRRPGGDGLGLCSDDSDAFSGRLLLHALGRGPGAAGRSAGGAAGAAPRRPSLTPAMPCRSPGSGISPTSRRTKRPPRDVEARRHRSRPAPTAPSPASHASMSTALTLQKNIGEPVRGWRGRPV